MNSADQTGAFLAREILALTKMNWNNTQCDGGEPITLRAARQVGSLLKYVDPSGNHLSTLYVAAMHSNVGAVLDSKNALSLLLLRFKASSVAKDIARLESRSVRHRTVRN